MRYINYLKISVVSCKTMFIASSCTYGVLSFFGLTKPIVYTPERTIGIIVGIVLYILGDALFHQYYDSLKE